MSTSHRSGAAAAEVAAEAGSPSVPSQVTTRGRRATLRRLTTVTPGTVVGAFLVSGTVHLVRPQVFTPIVPGVLPRPTELVYLSGVAELVCAAGLLAKARWAGPVSAAVLLAVWPANLQMAVDRTRACDSGPLPKVVAAAAWARLPLQIPLVRAALSARRD